MASSSMEITYRLAVADDLLSMQFLQAQLNAARERQFIDATKEFHVRRVPHSLIETADLEKDMFVVAEVEKKIVGYAWGQLAERSSSKLSKLGYLEEVCVDSEQRGQGIAKRLLEELTVLFRERGCDHMTTHTDAENTGAQALYASFGMTPVTLELWKKL